MEIKNIKKYYAIGIFVLFLGLAIFPSTNSESNKMHTNQFTTNEETSIEKEVIFYRIGLDGVVTKIKINIQLEKETDINSAIAETCNKLYENDEELKQSDNSNREFISEAR